MLPPDDLWSDPSKRVISNGPVRTPATPAPHQIRLGQDGHVLEFILSYPMHIADGDPWPPLDLRVGDRSITICKPTSTMTQYHPQGRIGNEPADGFCSIINVFSPWCLGPGQPTHQEIWLSVELLLTWIRVKARHFWLLHGVTGFGALYRGSLFDQNNGQIGQENFGVYGPGNMVVRPLDQDLWKTMVFEVENRLNPPVSESIFCDALLSIATGDDVKALLELGVACEIEISNLLDEVAGAPPTFSSKKEYLKKASEERFKTKLGAWPQKLGLCPADAFQRAGVPKNWVAIVKDLYKLRNSVAHSGKLKGSSVCAKDYVFAANALFAFAREQRVLAGLNVYQFPSRRNPLDQIESFNTATIATSSGKAAAKLSPP